jgi:hypothetical protein
MGCWRDNDPHYTGFPEWTTVQGQKGQRVNINDSHGGIVPQGGYMGELIRIRLAPGLRVRFDKMPENFRRRLGLKNESPIATIAHRRKGKVVFTFRIGNGKSLTLRDGPTLASGTITFVPKWRPERAGERW